MIETFSELCDESKAYIIEIMPMALLTLPPHATIHGLDIYNLTIIALASDTSPLWWQYYVFNDMRWSAVNGTDISWLDCIALSTDDVPIGDI